jgi:hypothetical protein
MGGGDYAREMTFDRGLSPIVKVPSQQTKIQDAVNQLAASGGGVEIEANEYFREALTITAPAGDKLEVRAGDKLRPIIVPSGFLTVLGGDNGEVSLNGLLISGSIHVPATDAGGSDNQLRRLVLRHLTVVPGNTITIESPNTTLEIYDSIVCSIVSADGAEVRISNSIVDATGEAAPAYTGLTAGGLGAPLRVENSTIIGTVQTLMVELASNTIFFADVTEGAKFPVYAERLQQGCVRFSYVPPGSRLPRLHRCQPVAAGIRPVFTSLRYGDAGYCQLSPQTAAEITEGADDRAEMGAFHNLFQPQRVSNLRARLDEYLRFGLEAGIFFAS